MASVYILYSQKLNRYYTGSCKDLPYRIGQHFNKNFSRSFTSKADDWDLYFYIEELDYKQARSIEAHIKKCEVKFALIILNTFQKLFRILRINIINNGGPLQSLGMIETIDR